MAKEKKPATRHHYTDDFKLKAVGRVINDGATVRGTAREFGVSSSILDHWVRAAKKGGLMRPQPQPEQQPLIESDEPVPPAPVVTQRGNKKYTVVPSDQKERAVALILSGEKTTSEVARDLSVHQTTVNAWVLKARRTDKPKRKVPPVHHQATDADGNEWDVRKKKFGTIADQAATIEDLQQQLAVAQQYIGKMTLELHVLKARVRP